MKYKHSILTLLFALIGFAASWAQNNSVLIPDMAIGKGKTVSMPVAVANSTDIVSVQFTLTVPDGFSADTSTAVLTERCAGHSLSMREIGSHKYMAMIFSPANAPISGSDGSILTVDLTASYDLEEESVHQLILSDVVLARANGDNMVTNVSAGKVTIESSPDFEVSDVSAMPSSVMPGEQLTVNWKVSNVGPKAASSGWGTDIYLEKDGVAKLVYSEWKDEQMGAGASMGCNASIMLPELLGLDGDARIKVQLTNADEKIGLQDNNTAYSDAAIAIGKKLYLNYPTLKVVEEDARTYMYKLSRSGSTASTQNFAVSLTPEDPRLSLDSEVSIPAGESEVYFQFKITPDGVLDDNESTTLRISGNGYGAVSSVVTIEDDVLPDALVEFDRDEVVEGGGFTLKATAYSTVAEDTPVTVTCDTPAKFTVPSGIVIPAGEKSVEIAISSKDNSLPDLDKEVGFTVLIAKHNPVTDYITLVDNDMPTLTLTLTPDAVAEDAGPLSVTAVIKRTDNIDKTITVQLRDNSNGQIYYGRQSFEMGAGVEEAVVNLGPIDNNAVDGERIIDITAAVYIASCSCAASDMASGGVVTAPLTVYDNDGPALALTTQSTVMKEGGELSIEISRNTSSESALTVRIESDHADRLEYPSSVQIPAGAKSASFTVKSLANEITDDGFNALFTASADGFAKGTAWITVTDQTLPDARVVSVTATPSEVFVDEEFIVDIVIANDGTYDLAAGVPVNVYANKSSDEIATAYTSESVSPGATTTVRCPVTIRGRVGENTVFAAVNENRAVKELVYTNNSSNVINVTTLAPFGITVSTDKAIYQPGETVRISGRLSGKRYADEEIEVYIINEGYRQTITARSDANGDFSCEYTPVSGLTGHFAIGACYPGEDMNNELTSMDIYGFRRTDGIVIQFDVVMDQAYAGSFDVINTGILDQSNVSASVVEQPEGCEVKITGVETTDDGKTYTIYYEITGKRLSTGNQYEKFTVRVTSAEGGSLDSSIYFYCVAEDCVLNASIGDITTTVTKGSVREYPFTITNTGRGETGKITFSLPSWITPATPKVMASLKQDESAEVVLRIAAQDEFVLNAAITGRISLNCESGRGLVLPFSITPVSESTGTLSVDVCDEASYASPGAPHVSGAKVKVTNPYTGTLVAEGVTGEDGIYSVVIPEGQYKLSVTDEAHGDSYDGVVLVDPGVVTSRVVNLSIQGIDLEWTVEETTVEDEYEITTNVKYEVNVPVPVVELILPNSVDADYLAEGESLVFNAVLVNHGLVTAEDVDLLLPTGFNKYRFDKLSHHEPFNLGAKQSVQIPVKITRLAVAEGSAEDGCYANIGTIYYWDCGSDRKWKQYYVSVQVGPCRSAEIVSFGSSYVGGGGGAGGPGLRGGGGWSGGYSASMPSGIVDTDRGCEPCQNAFLYKMTVGFVKKTSMVTEILNLVDQVNFAAGSSDVKGKLNEVLKQIPVLKNITEWLEFYYTGVVPLFADCAPGSPDSNVPVISDPSMEGILANRLQGGDDVSGYPSYVQAFLNRITPLMNSINAVYQTTTEICGDPCWNFVSEQELALLAAQFVNWDGTYEILLPYKPSNITEEQFRRFALRVYNTLNSVASDNAVDMQKVDACYRELVAAIDFSVKSGYSSLADMFNAETNAVMKSLNESRNSVCSTVTFQFSQSMVMTRQAFRGTLKVSNGHESLPVEDFRLHLTVADEDGKVATSHEFQTAPESLTGFVGPLDFESGWTLGSNTNGQATVLFIPTKYAAPTDPKKYSFGGFVTYTDPFTGSEAVRSLTPVTLTVSPSPVLDLTYFMQRDVIGDDPLTETVEPCQEAEFSLLINNTGYGDANDVRMLTQQPQVIDNRKGLLIDMQLLSSQLNGGDKTLALGGSVATDFGTIPAKSTSYAQWWFTSSLLGHFVDYDVTATHVTSYGNPDLSLLGDVTIHELIRSIKVGLDDDNVIGFLTNDLTDENDTPDMLYVSDGDILPVAPPSSCGIEKISDTECVLTVESRGDGWVYGNVLDPTYGCAELQSVVRQSDGAVMPARNFWLTDRTLRDGKDPIYENRIHFADDIRNASETYLLRFDSIPALTLGIVSIDGVPAEGTVLAQPLETVNVVFNKRIDPASFTADDITLITQGEPRDVALVGFATEDNKTFTLDLTALNDTVINGYYVLTVRTADITDEDGYNGKDGKQAAWVMYFNNQTRLSVRVQPENSGVVDVDGFAAEEADPSVRYVTYGASINIKETPKEGYGFIGWYAGDEYLSNDSVMSRTMLDDLSLIARFARRKVNLSVADGIEGGEITGAAAGVYLYGDTVRLTAVAAEDFIFGNWTVDGEDVAGDGTLQLVLKGDTEVSAKFIRELYTQTFSIYEGWNWISSYLMEPIDVMDFNSRTNRILGQFSESIQDPMFGMIGDVENFNPGNAYKVQSNLAFLKTVKGHLYDLAQQPIELHAGWNWVSYPYFEARTIESTVTNSSEGDFIISQLGFAEYSDGYWQGSIQSFDPGAGYLYKSSVDKRLALDFSRPESMQMIEGMKRILSPSRSEEVDVHKRPNTMNMTVALTSVADMVFGSDYTIYAMVGNECRGVSIRVGDLHYLTVYGDEPVDVTFVVENRQTGETFMASDTLQFRNDIVGSRKAPYEINISDISGVNGIDEGLHRMKIYTPTGILIDGDADFETIKTLTPGIYIIDGRKVLVK